MMTVAAIVRVQLPHLGHTKADQRRRASCMRWVAFIIKTTYRISTVTNFSHQSTAQIQYEEYSISEHVFKSLSFCFRFGYDFLNAHKILSDNFFSSKIQNGKIWAFLPTYSFCLTASNGLNTFYYNLSYRRCV